MIYYRKSTGKPFVTYGDAVEEALCFGWIDSTQRPNDEESYCQRFTPRNPKSEWSELNKERARRLIENKLMTPAGSKLLPDNLFDEKFEIPKDILKELKKDPEIWENFEGFPEHYKRIRIAYIDGGRRQGEDIFKARMTTFLKKTKLNKMYGTILP